MNRQVFDPIKAGNSLSQSPWEQEKDPKQTKLLEKKEMKYESK